MKIANKREFKNYISKLPENDLQVLFQVYYSNSLPVRRIYSTVAESLLIGPPVVSNRQEAADYLDTLKKLSIDAIRFIAKCRLSSEMYNACGFKSTSSKKNIIIVLESELIYAYSIDLVFRRQIGNQYGAENANDISPEITETSSEESSSEEEEYGLIIERAPARKQILPRSNIPSALRHTVWNTYLGEEKGTSKCFCCKSETISRANFHCGHVIAHSNGGETTVQNLRPICPSCNMSMGSKNMEDFMRKCGFGELYEDMFVIDGEFYSEDNLFEYFPWLNDYKRHFINIFRKSDEYGRKNTYELIPEYYDAFMRRSQDFLLELALMGRQRI